MFENNKDRTTHTGFYLPKVEIKNYSVIKFLHQPIKKWVKKIEHSKDWNWSNRLLYNWLSANFYFKEYYKTIVRDLSKQQQIDADPIANQEINFTGNLDRAGNTAMFFIVEVRNFQKEF